MSDGETNVEVMKLLISFFKDVELVVADPFFFKKVKSKAIRT